MIKSIAFDVEIFPNLFSITFVDLQDYLRVFSDCIDNKRKPVPLTAKLTVAEIKRRLDTVKSDIFYISGEKGTNDQYILKCNVTNNGKRVKDGVLVFSGSVCLYTEEVCPDCNDNKVDPKPDPVTPDPKPKKTCKELYADAAKRGES